MDDRAYSVLLALTALFRALPAAKVAHPSRAAVQLADRCMRACGSAFHAAVAASLLDRLVKARGNRCLLLSHSIAFGSCFRPFQIGLEARSQDAATSQLQWECCRCVQSWGTELLPRLGQYAEATRRVAARNAAAARMTQHVEQQWPRSSRHADEMSSVGSLSSVSTATSSASVNTMCALPCVPACAHAAITPETGPPLPLRARVGVLAAPPLRFAPSIQFSKIPILTSWMHHRPSFRGTRPYRRLLGVEGDLLGVELGQRRLYLWDKGWPCDARVVALLARTLHPSSLL